MKKVILVAAVLLSVVAIGAYASDYQGNEKEESKNIFQKLGDFFTGNYIVDGKPLKEKGVIQVMADQVNDMKLSGTSDEASPNTRQGQ